MQGDHVEFADRKALAVKEQVIELAAVTLEFGSGVEDLAEDVLDDTDLLADAERTAELFLDVRRCREVVRVDVGLENPLTSSLCFWMKAMSSSADSVAVRPEAAS